MTTNARLSSGRLDQLPQEVRRPAYDRLRLTAGIVHLGLGGFARCHLAAVTEDVLDLRASANRPLNWGIVGVSLRRLDQRDILRPQDHLYTAIERGPAAPRVRVIGAVMDVLVAPEDPAAVLARIASPETRIVTLTVTEKGYPRDAATGGLAFEHPEIQHDLANPERPVSAVGVLVAALEHRQATGRPPLTVVSCDNLQNNGHVLRALVVALAERRSLDLARWIAERCRFPNTMVDRIVPAPTEEDRADAHHALGLTDLAAISHEPFLQWVIEDDFVDGVRPEWEAAGAEFVSDVAPYERMKLRMLNAAHSALAYLGYLAGHETIGSAIGHPAFARYCERLWHDEVISLIDGIATADLERYAASLAERFANPAIRHRTWQIAMDGSLKLPLRILPTIAARRSRGLASPCLTLAVAAWMVYVGGVDERGGAIDVRDPQAGRLRAALDAAGPDPTPRVRALLNFPDVFPPALADDHAFARDLVTAYTSLRTNGAAAAVTRAAYATTEA